MPFDQVNDISAKQQIRIAAIESAMYFHAGEGGESDATPADVLKTAAMFEAYITAGS